MLHCDKIDVSIGNVIYKTSKIKKCIFCILVFPDNGLKFQSSVCNGCDDISGMYIDINSIVILTIYDIDYCCIIIEISKREAIHLLKNAGLSEL